MYKNSKTIVITGAMGNNTPEFSKFISLDFQPDEVKVKRVSIYDADCNNATSLILLNTDLVYPNTIYSYSAQSSVGTNDETPVVETITNTNGHNDMVDASFKISNLINSTYRFWVTKWDNSPVDNLGSFNSRIAITLVFYEYQK